MVGWYCDTILCVCVRERCRDSMVLVGISVTGHGFLDSCHRVEFNDIKSDYIRPNHYKDLGWSDDFYGLGVKVVSKILIGKSDAPL